MTSSKLILTYKYRIKDSASRQSLVSLSYKVNYVFNYVNELHALYFTHANDIIIYDFTRSFVYYRFI
jgi:hypothetical protein